MKRTFLALATLLAVSVAAPTFARQAAPPTAKPEAAAKADPKAAAAFNGKWNMETQSPNGAMQIPLEVKVDAANKVTGTLTGPNGATPITGEVKDGKLGFSINFDAGGQMVEIYFESTLADDKLTGTMSLGDMGSFPFTAVRVKGL